MSELGFETPLARWLRETNKSAYEVARGTGITHKHVTNLRDGMSLPGLVVAFKLDRFTKGAVSPSMWLDTPKARLEWEQHSNWEKWQEQRKAEQRRNAGRRKAALRHSPEDRVEVGGAVDAPLASDDAPELLGPPGV